MHVKCFLVCSLWRLTYPSKLLEILIHDVIFLLRNAPDVVGGPRVSPHQTIAIRETSHPVGSLIRNGDETWTKLRWLSNGADRLPRFKCA
ncbi:hypothetical protein BDZ97DRAFT_1863628 [Flammula alnicola]|nr:hypothetical protein BDZ97DRAFT_1863628 [Flammula alnicola]